MSSCSRSRAATPPSAAFQPDGRFQWARDRAQDQTMLRLMLLSLVAAVARASLSGLYVDNGVDQTVIQRVLSRQEKREVEHEILHLLGLPSRPRSVPPKSAFLASSAPKFMLDVYKSLLEPSGTRTPRSSEFNLSGNDLRAIDTSDAIMSFAGHVSDHRVGALRHQRGKRLWFDVSEVPLEEIILGAELRLFHVANNSASARSFVVNVYQLDGFGDELRFLDSVNSTTHQEGWLLLNVSGALSSWVAFPKYNKGLYIVAHLSDHPGHNMHPDDIGIVISKGEKDRLPFMVAFLKAVGNRNVHTRSARDTQRKRKTDISSNQYSYAHNTFISESYPNWPSRSCQLQNLYVNFRDLEWHDWIIAPDGYNAWYCTGECNFPLNAHMNATNHAIVQTLAHLMDPLKVPKPCCAPTKLGYVHVLYYLDESVTLNKYKNMVVKSCGCH